MVSQENFSRTQHTILLDISLFVLDMLSPEKIKNKYLQKDDGITLEVPSAFITMIADAQAGNQLLRQFISANITAVKNNPFHKQSKDLLVQELVNSTDEKLEEIKERIYQTILSDFFPLVRDISKVEQLINNGQSDSQIYPIQVYEPLIPVSQQELRTLRLAYFQELNLQSHPLFDLYFLQIYHAQTENNSDKLNQRRELLSLGRTTYKTLAVWRQALFGDSYDEKYVEFSENQQSPTIDASKELIKILIVNYFKERWIPIVETTTSIIADIVLTIPQSGNVGLEDVGLILVGLTSVRHIVKGITDKKESPDVRIFLVSIGVVMICCTFIFFPATSGLFGIDKLFASPTPLIVFPQVIITVPIISEVTPSAVSTDIIASPTNTQIIETPTLFTIIPTIISTNVNNSSDINYCMYVIQSNDTLQSVASHFRVSEDQIKSENPLVSQNIFVVNQLIKVNTSCCTAINNNGFSYFVLPNDDLFSLATRYSTSVEAIASANNLSNPRYIQAGQMLCIPYP